MFLIDLTRLSTVIVAVGLALVPARADPSSAPQPPTSAGADRAADPAQDETRSEAVMPAREKDLIDIFVKARQRYVSRESGTSAKDVRMEMQVELFRFMGKGQDIQDWIGAVQSHGTTPEGDVWLTIEIGDGIILKTWQTRMADGADHTLIAPYVPLSRIAEKAKIGEIVSFSGRIAASVNDTDDAMISRPQLIARFKTLRIAQ